MPDLDILIVGGGAAGLSAAGALRQRKLSPLILDRRPRVGDVWAERYDRLHLHTVYSSLAHYPLPRSYPKYPSKDQYAAYLQSYARHFGLKVVGGCAVRQVRPAGDAGRTWLVETDIGMFRSRVVIIASGQYNQPIVPNWPGRAEFGGAVRHSSEYRNAGPYAGQRVLVVGIGNSGAEIATDLAEHGAAFVAISIRTQPPIVARDPFGMPAQRSGLLLARLPAHLADALARAVTRLALGDLTRIGLARPAWWPYTARHVPVIDVGFVGAVRRGLVQPRPNVARLAAGGVVYADGRAEQFDAIVAATGFRSGLGQLLSLPGALEDGNFPAFESGQPTSFPGLYFIGFTHSLRGHLYEANRDSRRLARAVERYLGFPESGDRAAHQRGVAA